jgi:hypothetical protein
MDAKKRRRIAAQHQKALAAVSEVAVLLPHIPTADSNLSNIQRIFKSYTDCPFLTGEAVKDDNGTVLQSAAWLCENRFDNFLDELSYALVEAGVSRDALMKVFLRHTLRVLNEHPLSLHAGADDNKYAIRIIDELMRERNIDEFLREKVSKIAEGLPVPLGLQFK